MATKEQVEQWQGLEPVYPIMDRSDGTNRYKQKHGEEAKPPASQLYETDPLYDRGPPKGRRMRSRKVYVNHRNAYRQNKSTLIEVYGTEHPELGDMPEKVRSELERWGLGQPIFGLIRQQSTTVTTVINHDEDGKPRLDPLSGQVVTQVLTPKSAHQATFVLSLAHEVDPINKFRRFTFELFDANAEARVSSIVSEYQHVLVELAGRYRQASWIPTEWHPEARAARELGERLRQQLEARAA